MPEIDGLRFFAIIPVVLWHLNSRAWRAFESQNGGQAEPSSLFDALNAWLGAKTGVELFFVISGFILAMPFLRAALLGDPRPSLTAFYRRRLTRLEPPYILATLTAYAFLMLTMSDATQASLESRNGFNMTESLLASLAYLHGLLLFSLPSIIPVAWSLEIEFQFYLLAPGIFFLICLSSFHTMRIVLCGALVLFFLLLVNPLQLLMGEAIRFNVFRYLHFFLLGTLICQLYCHYSFLRSGKKDFIWDALFVAAFAVLLWTETHMTDYRRATPLHLEFARLAAFAVLVCAAFKGRLVSTLLAAKWVSLIGGMCYSIYLLHLPLQQVIVPLIVKLSSPDSYVEALFYATVISLPMTLLVCGVFFILVEKPCMNPNWPGMLKRKIFTAVSFKQHVH